MNIIYHTAICLLIIVLPKCLAYRSFEIDYDNNTFVKDGYPFRYISGSIHYARIPEEFWEDRLQKMAWAGLNAIQVYIPWNVHEPEPGRFDFSGQNDVIRFLRLAQKYGLLVILRPGPYICAEWEYGGFPYWLKMNNQSIVLRSMDPGYIGPVSNYFGMLLPKLEPLLYVNGGPIIMVQVENEYGSYGGSVANGTQYLEFLRDTFRHYLGDKVQLFTTDGSGLDYLKYGTIKGAYATVDFGPGDAKAGFAPMRQWNPKGPLVNSEYYVGWLDVWNGTWSFVKTETVTKTLKDMLDMGANVNMYMFEGGTNFGFMNGADPSFKPSVTSYDYDAPMSEAGDLTNKYLAIRELLKQYVPVPPNVLQNTTKMDYGKVNMQKALIVSQDIEQMISQKAITSKSPVTMETASQAYGFALYRHTLKNGTSGTVDLAIPGIRDRANVLLDGLPQGVVYRNANTSVRISAKAGQILDIFVENMGRINYGSQINDNLKGIDSDVMLDKTVLSDWTYYALNISYVNENIFSARPLRYDNGVATPSVYRGVFRVPEGQKPADTFLNMCGWTKGVVLVNGHNLGRYWPTIGPQVTLYVPSTVLKPFPQFNIITMLELETSPCLLQLHEENQIKIHGRSCSVAFVKDPILGAKCDNEGTMTYLNMTDLSQSLFLGRMSKDHQL